MSHKGNETFLHYNLEKLLFHILRDTFPSCKE